MNSRFSVFAPRFSTGHALWAAVLIPACVLLSDRFGLRWLGITAAVLVGLAAVLTFRGRRLAGWIVALAAWRRRHRHLPAPPSEAAVGATVFPGDPVAVRWQDGFAVSAIELLPRPFTPTVIVNGKAVTDDVIDTRLVESLLCAHCPDLEADVVSAGFRVGKTAPAALLALYDQIVGPYPAPANRRTWILLRANPERAGKSALLRSNDIAGLAQYLVASAVRLADQLCSNGVDARPAAGFGEYDRETAIAFERETWSMIQGRSTFTAAYHAPGGPNAWWSARADHTVTRVRVTPGSAPTSTVLLTTSAHPSAPHGFSCLSGGQRAALAGESPVTDRHHELPIGSAGVLVGETADRYPVYLPFDDVDTCIDVGDARLLTQFVVRSAAAGADITVGPRLQEFAGSIGARVGQESKICWPRATTYLQPRQGPARVTLRSNSIETPRHGLLPIRLIHPREENRYQMALNH